ncbi:ATP-grasp domain-containing protein [Methylopila henanensis]|uniref:ATP-grasp domain-containing protein n=1 Tax=Methylopila henanensis TaxID=873516 RepID=A0ABW4K009_9HYPH
MSSPASSRRKPFGVALIGLSTRALARSARRAGLAALALDLFADADTREHAACVVRVRPRRRGVGLDPAALMAALEAHAPAGLPVVFGAGFEDATGLMAAVGRRHPIRGAAPETVRRLKDPFAFAALLRSLGVAHPDVADIRDLANLPPGWLSKRVGGSGGAHIRSVDGRAVRGRYAQARVAGSPFSALFLADGRRARVVAFSAQWADPTPAAPFRYGGAVGPLVLPPEREQAVAAMLDRLVAASGLVGLASADMIATGADEAGFALIEINPRPGATLDLFDHAPSPSLLAAHLTACDGRLPDAAPRPVDARAAAVVYAPHATTTAGVSRPAWTADWPASQDLIPRGAPVCTALAAAATPEAARALVERRRLALLAALPSVRGKAAPEPQDSAFQDLEPTVPA